MLYTIVWPAICDPGFLSLCSLVRSRRVGVGRGGEGYVSIGAAERG